MKEIVIPQEVIYEFWVDPQIIDLYIEKIKKSPINYKKIKGSDQTQLTQIIYPIPFSKNLFETLTENLNKVGKILLDEPINLSICDAWLTYTAFGCQSEVHNHSFSLLSGLLYLDDSKTVTEFYYKSEFRKRNEGLLMPRTSVQGNKKIQIKPEKGKLIIWPSYIHHRVSMHKETVPRYTLAFNSFIDGTVSTYKTGKLTCNTIQPEYLEY